MTQPIEPPPFGREVWKRAVFMVLRITVSIAVMFTAYYLIPARGAQDESDVPWLILELAIFAVVVGLQVPFIVKAKFPVLRAVEALAVTIPLFLLIFSRVYLSNSLYNPGAFSEPLDNTTAFYFTVTVFATVGFGDIVAKTNGMKLLVTTQMLLNLGVLGLVIRLVSSAARRGIAKRARDRDSSATGAPGQPSGSGR
jgi:UDP-N-acetylmuramyl pentapeptide phosphotransferase/UDP-N-acetylglucosamine-1-phosphate transferase